MQNLATLRAAITSLDDATSCCSLSFDASKSSVFALSSSGLLKAFNVSSKPVEVCSWLLYVPGQAYLAGCGAQLLWELNLGDTHTWIDATYVPALEGVCCVSASGQIVCVSDETPAVELVGDFPCGTIAVCWSPDLEIVALVNGDSTLVTMTSQWKVISCPRAALRAPV
jgi:hypothetical protein